jgi:hypothetical protein
MSLGSCRKGCELFKISNPASDLCRWCGHDSSEHVAIGMLLPDGMPSYFPVAVATGKPVVPAVIKDVEKRERNLQFKRAVMHHEPGY